MKRNFIFLILFFTNSSFAADLAGLKELFARSFWTDMYVNNHCRDNIERFVKHAQKEGVNLDNSFMIQMVNDGLDMFGMIAAISVREQGRLIVPIPKRPPFRNIGTFNWNYHFILIADDVVFDFDFTNSNRVVKLPQYMTEQFIPAAKRNDLRYMMDKIGQYKFTIFPAEDYMSYRERRVSMELIRTEMKFRDYLPNYFR